LARIVLLPVRFTRVVAQASVASRRFSIRHGFGRASADHRELIVAQTVSKLSTTLASCEADIIGAWTSELLRSAARWTGAISEGELRAQCAEFLTLLQQALARTEARQTRDTSAAEWQAVREMLGGLSRSRGQQGFTPTETALFVFSLKAPVLACLRRVHDGDAAALTDDVELVNEILDHLGLLTFEVYQKGREEVIMRQQQDMLELSTPVVKLWDGVLALPMIGTLDSARTQVVMEALLQRIVETGAEIAIIDITGVPTVDTLTAQHLLKTVTAARLMGAECIISGIRPQIAQTIVHLGVELQGVTTKATLADAFSIALKRLGIGLHRAAAARS
jgi:rsbT co-antagonist protein RsbR